MRKPYRRAHGRVKYYDRCRTCHNARTNKWHHANRNEENYKRKLRDAGVTP